jgi:RimJ/RimL family protein N-acetyltransferase
MVLRPATSEFYSELVEAFEETWPEVSRAMPWINPDLPFDTQIEDFLAETERMGRSGLLHHWVMVRPWDGALLGLIGFDQVTRSGKAVWNLGYWVRSSEQQHGFARRAIDASLHWLGEAEKSSVELKVDPHNPAGRSTVKRTVREWKGERCVDGDSAITVAGVRTPHECHLVIIGPGLGPE